MFKILVYDFEVFKHDTLFGALIIENDTIRLVQTWDLEEIRDIYESNINSIWVGHNNQGYDDYILEAIVQGCNEEQVKAKSDDIIKNHKTPWLRIKLFSYDLMAQHFYSLKLIEAYMGKNISETKVDFNLDRKLTNEEKALTESYNRDDLEQTFDDLQMMLGTFTLRLDVIKEFKLPMNCLAVSGTRLAEEVLGAKKTPGIETWVVKPKMYDTLQIKNKEVIDFYLNEDFRAGKNVYVTLCGAQHKLGAGGIHAALSKYHCKKALYCDVSGYYNLVMLNYDLLPRSIPQVGKDKYRSMYYDQLEMKKTGDPRRGAYKTILLSVFGAMMNEHCRFYDPYHGLLVTMTGQIFLVDLLEKLEGKAKVIQSNTDGIIIEPYNWDDEAEIISIIEAWEKRTGFVIKKEHIFDIHQRDVNCYMYRDAKGNINTLGEAVKDYGKWEYPFWKESYKSKEPLIIPTCVVEYFMFNKKPEEVVKENLNNLRMFQYLCKKLSFDWLEYQENNLEDGTVTTTTLQNVNRAFALKSNKIQGMVYKRKHVGKVTKSKVSNLADNVFVFNGDIRTDEAVKELQEKIDFDYYVARAYERINEFVQHSYIKDVNIYV